MSKVILVTPDKLTHTSDIDHTFVFAAGIRVPIAFWGLFTQKSQWRLIVKSNARQTAFDEDEGIDAMRAVLPDLPECVLLTDRKHCMVAKLLLEEAGHTVILSRQTGVFKTEDM